MSAELLRRAAETLRQHAQAATSGPWTVERYERWDGWQAWNILGVAGEDGVTPISLRTEAQYEDDFAAADADTAYAALLGPPVALALADLLHREANHQDAMRYAERETRIEEGSLDGPHEAAALALARAILREPKP